MNNLIIRKTQEGYDFIHLPKNFNEKEVGYFDIINAEGEVKHIRINLFGHQTYLNTQNGKVYHGNVTDIQLGEFLIIHEHSNVNGSVTAIPEKKEVKGSADILIVINNVGKVKVLNEKIGYKREMLSFPLSNYRTELIRAWRNYKIPEDLQAEILKMNSLQVKEKLNSLLANPNRQNKEWITLYNAFQQAYYVCEKQKCYEYYQTPVYAKKKGYDVTNYNIILHVNAQRIRIQRAERLRCNKQNSIETYRYIFELSKGVLEWQI